MPLLHWHNERVNCSRKALYGGQTLWNLSDMISVPPECSNGVYKCRVLYDTTLRSVEFAPYVPRAVTTLRLVEGGAIDYAYKYADRSALQQLYEQRGSADDILIVRNGCITDTSYSNVALYDGEHWYTPARPLLRGVRVRSLAAQGLIREADITPSDLRHFDKVVLLNAMLGFEERVEVQVLC